MILANDVAVLQTVQTINFNANVQPIPLIARTVDGDEMFTPGWGRTDESGSLQTELQFITTFAITYEECYENIEINPDNFCAFQSVGVGICIGDSGAGYEIMSEGLAGIASFIVQQCASGYPDGAVNVAVHRTWIINNTN